MRIQLAALATLSCVQANATPVDKVMDYNSPLNACMYRYGLTSIGFGLSPIQVREGVAKICAAQIEEVIDALIPPEPDGKYSLDVEGQEAERKKAAQSKLLQFLIDDFIKNYQSTSRRLSNR
jgi:hypothetical protein